MSPIPKYPTASGGTATADLMLHLIGRAHGSDLAIAVADQMLYNTARNADAAQRYSLQSRYGLRNTHIADAVRLMTEQDGGPGVANGDRRGAGDLDSTAGTSLRAICEMQPEEIRHRFAFGTGAQLCCCRQKCRSPRSRMPAASARPDISPGSIAAASRSPRPGSAQLARGRTGKAPRRRCQSKLA